jgi:WD40 repeat protein
MHVCFHFGPAARVAIALALAAVCAVRCPAGPDAEIPKLIEQLGDEDNLARRQEAARRLEALGEPALAALRQACKSHTDPDMRLRAALIIRAITTGGMGEVRHFGGNYGYWLNRVAFSRDGKQALAAGGAVIWYDLETGREVRRTLEMQFARQGLALSSDGRYFLTGHQHDRLVRMGEVATGKVVQTFIGHAPGVHAVAFSPDGARIVSGGEDRTLRLWDVKSGKELRRFDGVTASVRCAAFAPDGKRVLAGQSGGRREQRLRLWDVESGKEVRAFAGHTGEVTAVAFLPDGKTALSASMDGTLRLWDVESGKELRRMEHPGGARDAAVSPDGKRALSAGWGDRTVRLWDLTTGRESHRFEGHASRVLGVAFSPDGKRALSSDAQYTVYLWRVAK